MDKFTRTSLVIDISKLTELSVFGIDIQFEWIPAQCDLPGNKRADSLAKNATKKNI